jgi:hypothetical protein
MAAAAVALLPGGALGAGAARDLARALGGAAAMAAAARLREGAPAPLSALLALGAYATAVAALGGVRARDLALLSPGGRRP